MLDARSKDSGKEWDKCKYLGSLLGTEAGIKRRMFCNMYLYYVAIVFTSLVYIGSYTML